ncbi:MAG: TlpA family protein disulfide reductase [Bacteroidales bacterium]|nr:TlpA family protein disulfide reductase [Bacteroidales bacterium]
MGEVRQLIADRDSLVFNDLMGQKKNANAWAERVIALANTHIAPTTSKSAEYQQPMAGSKAAGARLVNDAQQILREIVNGYQVQYNAVDDYVNGRLIDLIKQHKDDIAVLMFVDMFPREQNAALHEEVVRALHVTNPEHPIVKERWNILNSPAGKTSIGAIAPDLAFPDPDGNIRKLSDLRGKVVLIDFWASWCGPCRRESPNVRNVYAKYHDKGFEVFSVSLDRDANNWKKAIKDDQLVWPNHVSDLKYWSSEAAAIYGVRSIPSMFLLDRDGRIVAKDLRGAALEQAVKQLLEK